MSTLLLDWERGSSTGQASYKISRQTLNTIPDRTVPDAPAVVKRKADDQHDIGQQDQYPVVYAFTIRTTLQRISN